MIKERNGRLIIKTPFNPEFVSAIKELGARWNGQEKTWSTGVEKKNEVVALVKRYFEQETEKAAEKEDTNEKNLKSRVDEIVADENVFYQGDTVERLVAFAYEYGREAATKEVSDQYRTMIREMRKRAEKSRYQSLINDAIGDRDYITLPEYSGRKTKEIGKLKTDL